MKRTTIVPWTARLLAVCLTIALTAGCAAGNATEGHTTGTTKALTITVWTYYNGPQLTAFNAMVKEFNETVGKSRGITVESANQGSVSDLENAVMRAARGGAARANLPNVFAAYADTAYAMDQMDMLADLSPYLSQEELSAYVDSYVEEGRISGDRSLKIFPIAKSTELLMINATDFAPFSKACGVSYDDLTTIEGLTEAAGKYYEWTDAATPDISGDGKAFFGRDAFANYMFIGAKELGTDLLTVGDGSAQLHFDKKTVRTLWNYYYIPFIKGYFAASGRFRSDDLKTGNVLCYVGSSASATYFPDSVIVNDADTHPIEMEVLAPPHFADGDPFAVQQGAGMAVTNASEDEVRASVEFLKWFTGQERNISFSVNSGYLPVTKGANQIGVIHQYQANLNGRQEKILSEALQVVNDTALYTPRAFKNGTAFREVMEHAMSDKAAADRETVLLSLKEGQTLEEATAEFVTDTYFDAWYEDTLSRLKELM